MSKEKNITRQTQASSLDSPSTSQSKIVDLDVQAISYELQELKSDLEKQIQDEVEKKKQSGYANPDRLDLADEFAVNERESLVQSCLEKQLNQVNDALKRINQGKFGVCARCKKPISTERLIAIPYASLCMDCQKKRERPIY